MGRRPGSRDRALRRCRPTQPSREGRSRGPRSWRRARPVVRAWPRRERGAIRRSRSVRRGGLPSLPFRQLYEPDWRSGLRGAYLGGCWIPERPRRRIVCAARLLAEDRGAVHDRPEQGAGRALADHEEEVVVAWLLGVAAVGAEADVGLVAGHGLASDARRYRYQAEAARPVWAICTDEMG